MVLSWRRSEGRKGRKKIKKKKKEKKKKKKKEKRKKEKEKEERTEGKKREKKDSLRKNFPQTFSFSFLPSLSLSQKKMSDLPRAMGASSLQQDPVVYRPSFRFDWHGLLESSSKAWNTFETIEGLNVKIPPGAYLLFFALGYSPW